MLTASVVPLVLVSLPAVRNDSQLGVGVMTGVFAALVTLGRVRPAVAASPLAREAGPRSRGLASRAP